MPRVNVSVIIPVYNGAGFLAAAVDSAVAQTQPPLEIIVVDDGSTDGTAAVARELPVVYIHQENAGVSTARNVAIEHSHGDLIALLDSDDLWLPDKLARQTEALQSSPDAGYATCAYRYTFEPASVPPSWWPPPWYLDGIVPATEPGYTIPSTWLIRRSTWDLVGLFDPKRSIGEDLDWLSRAKDLGLGALLVDEVLVHKREHERNVTSSIKTGGPDVWFHVLRNSIARKRAAEQP